MSNWAAGYTAEIDYTHGFYNELNPQRIRLAFEYNGLVCPEMGTACELGFGQGMSVNMLAAASVVRWWGTDFNPAQAGFAQEAARAAGSNAQLFDESFAEFAAREDLPDFDYICLHGIFSWIGDDNRRIIVDFIRRKLKVGGVLYISYNTLPGWSDMAPMRHLMSLHAQVQGSKGEGALARAGNALEFADRLMATDPQLVRMLPTLQGRMAALKGQNRNYLSHEYFNLHWDPMYFSDMARWLEDAKLQFACSANYLDYVPKVNLTPAQTDLLAEVSDVHLVQTLRDYMVNQRFRKDYWVKGARRLAPQKRLLALRRTRVVLVQPREDVRTKFIAGLGESSLLDSVAMPLLDQLADYQIKSLAELEEKVCNQEVNFEQLAQAVMVLASIGQLEVAQSLADIAEAKKSTEKINAWSMNQCRESQDLMYLASPVTGGAFPVGRFHQLFLLSRAEGSTHPREWAQFVWEVLQQQGQFLIKDGSTLETTEENLAELVSMATQFAQKQMPVMQALQIA